MNKNKNSAFISRISLMAICFLLIVPAVVKAEETRVEIDLRLKPTSMEVSPTGITIIEGITHKRYFTLTAHYDYPGTTIPDRIFNCDPLIDPTLANCDPIVHWRVTDDIDGDLDGTLAASITTETGWLYPEDSLGVSRYRVRVYANYAGADSTPALIDIGRSGGGGGGTVIYVEPPVTPPEEEVPPPEEEITPPEEETTPPEETIPPEEETPPPAEDIPPEEIIPPEELPVEPIIEEIPPTEEPPPEQTLSEEIPPDEPTTDQPSESTSEVPAENPEVVISGSQTPDQLPSSSQTPENVLTEEPTIPEIPTESELYAPLEKPVSLSEVKPLSEVFTEKELTTPAGGTSRSAIVKMIAEKMNILELRKPLLDKCYADLENCTTIFRMYSRNPKLSLDPLNLFPDTAGLPEEKIINNMALIGLVQGFYGIENSPYLPGKPILRIEALKIMTVALALLEKSSPDYKAGQIDYSSLFYREIYAASLLSKMSASQNQALQSYIPTPLFSTIRVAHALTEQAWELIKAQKTPFADVRPDQDDAHWYYPIVLNKVCELELIDCTPGSDLKPDDNPTLVEVNAYLDSFNAYIRDKKIDVSISADTDTDGLLNVDENLTYFTSPVLSDSDEDALQDGEEVIKYKTNPNKVDTDEDGVSDGDEILKFKTDPNLYDSDEDNFSDADEIKEGSDPLDKASIPEDKNSNGISDEWEIKYNIQVKDGSQDTDGDGVADKLEYIYATDPTRLDSDQDGFTDSEELYGYLSNPNDALDPGEKANTQVIINNFQYGQVVGDTSPLIRGIGPAGIGDNIVKIQMLLRNEFGSELMMGETQTDAKGNFVYIPSIEIKDGTYFLVARAIDKGDVYVSQPVKIIIDSSLEVAAARPEKLENVPITDEVLVKKVVLKIDSKDGRPVLTGTLSEFGSKVNVTWQSLVVSSALIVDTTDGVFNMKAPLLSAGRHTVYVQTVRKRDNAMSKTIKINFDLGLIGPEKPAAEVGKESVTAVTKGITEFVSKQPWPFWIGLLTVLVMVGGGLYIFVLGKDDDKEKKDQK